MPQDLNETEVPPPHKDDVVVIDATDANWGTHPDDLFVHISQPRSTNGVIPQHVWLKFKAEVLSYVAGKLKDLAT
jgi:hypothetical protein